MACILMMSPAPVIEHLRSKSQVQLSQNFENWQYGLQKNIQNRG